MSEFEFLAGFYGLLLGLIVAEIATKLADAVDSREHRPIGILTPLLAVVVLGDVTSFWLWVWFEHDRIHISWETVYVSTFLGITYFLAAALVFPRDPEKWPSLDAHYAARKQWVVMGLLLVNAFVLVRSLTHLLPDWSDTWFFVWIGTFFIPLFMLLFTRRRWVDVALLGWLAFYYVIAVIPGLPSSQWSKDLSLASTSAEPGPK